MLGITIRPLRMHQGTSAPLALLYHILMVLFAAHKVSHTGRPVEQRRANGKHFC